jgi:predicted dehydrogenase
MPKVIRWGVLGVAHIAMRKVIPAMQRGSLTEVVALASRDAQKAQAAAAQLGIPRAYSSYEDLLADPRVDAIYNPLPNHLHVPWSIRAAEAGKHVLCEKPIALTVAEVKELGETRDRTGVQIGEAFMVRTHPQWLRARQIVDSGEIGDLRSVIGAFSYYNVDASNIRNMPEYGGGALLDIGCYPVTISRFLFRREPARVSAAIERDAALGTDTLTSALLDFSPGQAVFTSSTQLVPYQNVQILGTRGRIEIPIPFNAPPDKPCQIVIDPGKDVFRTGARVEEFPVCDQYTIQGDLFSKAILEGGPVPVPLEDSLSNMAVLEAIFRAAKSGKWESPRLEG